MNAIQKTCLAIVVAAVVGLLTAFAQDKVTSATNSITREVVVDGLTNKFVRVTTVSYVHRTGLARQRRKLLARKAGHQAAITKINAELAQINEALRD